MCGSSVCAKYSAPFGLLLPGAFRIRTELTPLAALGLTTSMISATMFTLLDQLQLAIVPVGVGLLAACMCKEHE
jgi:hypothetical protein